jgi:hypothetical protein
MLKLLLITIFTTILFATNPRPYAALGDVIYNNVDKIAALSYFDAYSLYAKEIDSYVEEVKETKVEGFKLEMGDASISKKEYLDRLRKLSKTNDYFLRSIRSNYKTSMKNNNFALFSLIINSGLINTKSKKDEIIDYYFLHQEDINATGVIDNFLNDDAKLRARKEAQRRMRKTKKQLEEEKIKRIRAKDKASREKLEKKLQEDLEKKKLEIRETQKKELSD